MRAAGRHTNLASLGVLSPRTTVGDGRTDGKGGGRGFEATPYCPPDVNPLNFGECLFTPQPPYSCVLIPPIAGFLHHAPSIASSIYRCASLVCVLPPSYHPLNSTLFHYTSILQSVSLTSVSPNLFFPRWWLLELHKLGMIHMYKLEYAKSNHFPLNSSISIVKVSFFEMDSFYWNGTIILTVKIKTIGYYGQTRNTNPQYKFCLDEWVSFNAYKSKSHTLKVVSCYDEWRLFLTVAV